MLSEDEKKAIEDLNSFKSISILYGNTFTMFLDQLKKYQQATDTVLNLITKLQKENEKYKYLYQKALDNTVKADRENLQLKKQIDLMLEFIVTGNNDLCKNLDIPKKCKYYAGENKKLCNVCLKQYFETKAKKGE